MCRHTAQRPDLTQKNVNNYNLIWILNSKEMMTVTHTFFSKTKIYEACHRLWKLCRHTAQRSDLSQNLTLGFERLPKKIVINYHFIWILNSKEMVTVTILSFLLFFRKKIHEAEHRLWKMCRHTAQRPDLTQNLTLGSERLPKTIVNNYHLIWILNSKEMMAVTLLSFPKQESMKLIIIFGNCVDTMHSILI